MNWFVIFLHLIGIIAVNVLPWIVASPKVLLAILFILVTASAQWHIIDQCIFSKLENGSQHSIFVLWLQRLSGWSYETLGKLWVFFLNYVPTVVCLARLWILLLP